MPDYEVYKIWKRIDEKAKKHLKYQFLKSLNGYREYYNYYEMMHLNRLINDSVFINFFKKNHSSAFEIERRKKEDIERGWQPIPHLDCEPEPEK